MFDSGVFRKAAVVLPLAVLMAAGAVACSSAGSGSASDPGSRVTAVAAENEYGDVLSQVGGRYVAVTSIMNNPATDPHTYEASPQVAQTISGAQLVVQNGVGYDNFMNTIEGAQASAQRSVIVVQHLLNLPDSTPNPHLWYKPGTMVTVANTIAADLARLQPSHAAYFQANAQKFAQGQRQIDGAITTFQNQFKNVPVATTEPVADYLLTAIAADNMTPWAFQADIMNGTDPSPQDIEAERSLFTGHKVKVFIYNQQVTTSLTESFIALARQNGVPVVGVYETMPVPGYDYQSWMLAELNALTKALTDKVSTEHL